MELKEKILQVIEGEYVAAVVAVFEGLLAIRFMAPVLPKNHMGITMLL